MKRTIVMILLALAANAVAQQVRVMVQVIEVPHAVLTKWTTTEKLKGQELHERAVKLTATGEAEILETSVLMARSGEKARTESVGERIYPTEFRPPELPSSVGSTEAKPFEAPHYHPSSRPVFSFETRNTGASLEIEPVVGKGLVDLRLRFEIVDRVALTLWKEFVDQWGDGSMRMPEFQKHSSTGEVVLVPGRFDLLTVFTPKPADVPAATTRQLVFVRCELLPAPANLSR